MNRLIVWMGSVVVIAGLFGCSSETATNTSAVVGQPTTEGAKFLLSSAPGEAQDVIPMREDVEDEQDVVVIGRIGGSHDPWVDGLAAFSLVDRSLAACTDIPGDQCPTPWDYCCVTDKLPAATTLVKVVDEQGELVSTGARELLGLTELQTVVIQGKAQKDDSGNVTILARGIYVDPTNPGQVLRGDADHDHAHGHDHTHDNESDTDHDEAEVTTDGGEGDS